MYKFLKLVTASARFHHWVERELEPPVPHTPYWWRWIKVFWYEVKLGQETKSTVH